MSGVYKIAAVIPISSELWEEWDRINHPWKYSDGTVLPEFDLFPRWTKLVAWRREWCRRFIDARLALHGQLREPEDRW